MLIFEECRSQGYGLTETNGVAVGFCKTPSFYCFSSVSFDSRSLFWYLCSGRRLLCSTNQLVRSSIQIAPGCRAETTQWYWQVQDKTGWVGTIKSKLGAGFLINDPIGDLNGVRIFTLLEVCVSNVRPSM